ncbi:hypothetical protein M2164_004872 [Streptomyces sp. SAI-208]|jgi:hypothetical protein|uniref:hypothetical protein n=1 Tax=unclassified Streptomyces TaxID=2593676 RepID=UPI0024738FBD|nr:MULTISPECIES: hypothetical protein [unclassified Streptomyces]MDH6550611.1 hypothetical protein [Streptomyces sp. SAI-041]MDH6569673.1 hypothetical protein [Streptomyces sp. SAI-117]MDH6609237.1 hypothetical protein [Streptomyces sp. SAI-208]
MSDENTTDNIHATDVEDDTPVSTDNIHATSEPLKATTLKADESTAEAGTDNIHATDEPV